jgi:hypothetical protein
MNELKSAPPIPVYVGGGLAGPAVVAARPTSAFGSLGGIFIEPVRVFDSFRQQPRFLLAACLIALALSFSTALIFQRLGFENILRAQMDRSATHLTAEQRQNIVELQGKPAMRALGVISPIVSLIIVFAAGGGLYFLGVKAVGGSVGYRQAVSVWVYSSLPPAILIALGNILLLFLQSSNDIDLARAGSGLVHANAGVFIDATTQPVLTTAVSSIDLFAIYALILAIIGLHKVARISPAKAATVAGSLWLVGCLLRIGVSAISNAPIG